jgi:hypothetical protein
MAEVNGRKQTIRRLAFREYLPMIGWVVTWLLIGLAIGHADAVRLLAATAMVRSTRYLTGPESGTSLRIRVSADGRIAAGARGTAIGVELAAVLVSLLALAAIVGLLLAAGEKETAIFCLVLSALLPARLLHPLFAGKRTGEFYQPLLAWTGVALAGLVWLVSRDALWFAAAIAAREWVAILIAGLIGRPREPSSEPMDRLHWREIADHSHATARRRFTYRVSKSLLKFVFGPFGSIAARTGRGFRMDRKLERFVPRTSASLGGLFLLLTTAAVALILIIPEPAVQLLAASLLRVGASAGNILIWSKLGRGDTLLREDEEDED